MLFLLIYVDDLSITSSKIFIKEQLNKHFKMKDLGDVCVERDRCKGVMYLDQGK